MSRAKWKGPFLDRSLFNIKFSLKPAAIWSRRSIISEAFVNKSVLVHTGKGFKRVYISREKVGFKFGEFCATKLAAKKKVTKQAALKKK